MSLLSAGRRRLLRLLTLAAVASLAPRVSLAQGTTALVTVRVTAEGGPIENAVVRVGERGAATNAAGLARFTLPAGRVTVRVAMLGYKADSASLVVAAAHDTLVAFALEPAAEELEGFVVTSARGARRMEDEPTRIEVLGGDDVAEKTEMRPNDLRNFLSEMAGIRVQQTGAGSGASAVRIQGLRPRYTLLLADGLPLYGAGGGGLDLLQLPPADLRQIEVIKGPASALYGASALGGTINLVSKRPGDESDILVQGTSQGGANAFGWKSKKVDDHFGYTMMLGLHSQDRRDTDKDGWAELPGYRRVEARPRLFFDGPNGNSIFVTAGATLENRDGGFMPGRKAPDGTSYIESTDTRRGDLGLVAHRLLGERAMLQFRGALNVDHKGRVFGIRPEQVNRSTAFSELSLSSNLGRHDLLVGTAMQRDANDATSTGDNFYTFRTASLFAQDVWRFAPKLALTVSVRADDHSRYDVPVSPRVSLLYGFVEDWSLRASVTRGYYAPTPFVEESEAVGISGVSLADSARAERASYASLDLNGKAGPVELNATVFASRVRDPLVAQWGAFVGSARPERLLLVNSPVATTSRGVEAFAIYDLAPLFITALYTYTDAHESELAPHALAPQRVVAPYVPRHTWGIDATWEDPKTGTWIALEGFYSGRQHLEDDPYRSRSHPYTSVGFLATQTVGRYKLFFNIENLANQRQTTWSPLVRSARADDGRWTVRPWGPLEGRIYSAGIRIHSLPHAEHEAGKGTDGHGQEHAVR